MDLEDSKIVDLYWQRSEEAIPETAAKFGGYCRTIAYNILSDEQDAEECVNDTWLKAWNSMPTHRPALLAPYLAKLTRWLSLTRSGKEMLCAAEAVRHRWSLMSLLRLFRTI